MKKSNNLVAFISILFIKEIYQKSISPILKKRLGLQCRFYPSCSNYGLMAIEKYGFILGWKKSVARIFRCNPENCDSCVDYP